jgi:lipopolysaccharide export system protein LptA
MTPPRCWQCELGDSATRVLRVGIIAAMKQMVVLVAILMAVCTASPLPLLARAAHQDKPVDVAGKWVLTVETAAGTGTPTIELTQDGGSLAGTYSSEVFGQQKLTGTIKGNVISFGFSGSVQGATVTVTYTGTADAATMKGKVTVGELGEGTFTGKRQ